MRPRVLIPETIFYLFINPLATDSIAGSDHVPNHVNSRNRITFTAFIFTLLCHGLCSCNLHRGQGFTSEEALLLGRTVIKATLNYWPAELGYRWAGFCCRKFGRGFSQNPAPPSALTLSSTLCIELPHFLRPGALAVRLDRNLPNPLESSK